MAPLEGMHFAGIPDCASLFLGQHHQPPAPDELSLYGTAEYVARTFFPSPLAERTSRPKKLQIFVSYSATSRTDAVLAFLLPQQRFLRQHSSAIKPISRICACACMFVCVARAARLGLGVCLITVSTQGRNSGVARPKESQSEVKENSLGRAPTVCHRFYPPASLTCGSCVLSPPQGLCQPCQREPTSSSPWWRT